MLVSAVQQCESTICINISHPSWASLPPPSPPHSHPSRSSQSTKLSSLCHTAASHQLSVLHAVLCVCENSTVPIAPQSPPPWASQVARGKEPACQCRRHRGLGSIPGSGRSPGGGNGNPRQYSCLDNSMHRGAWWVTVHRVAESQAWLSTHIHTRLHAPLCPQVHSQLLRLYSWPTTRIFFKDYILCYSFVNIHLITVLLLFIIYANISTYEYKYDVSINKYCSCKCIWDCYPYLYRTTISSCSNLREWEQWWVTSEEKIHGCWQGTDEMVLLRQKTGGNKCLRRVL